MPERATYLAAGLGGIAFAAMAWSAVPPSVSPLSLLGTQAEAAVTTATDWFRRGPADGHPDWEEAAYTVHGADASRGPDLMLAYGCTACHAIPGVAGANGSVGPPLGGFRHRAYVAGVLPNEPGGLVRWLVNPTVHAPNTAMPDLGVTEDHARDMAAYLYTLRGG